MFRTVILVAALMASVAAFRPASSMSSQSFSKLSMSAEFLPGALAPLGYFDPLGLSKDKTEGEVKVRSKMLIVLIPSLVSLTD